LKPKDIPKLKELTSRNMQLLLATLKVVLSICATFNLEMAQLDIKIAFLYGLADEEIYIQQLKGFI
jgi:surfactin synthase thioesterase subunit